MSDNLDIDSQLRLPFSLDNLHSEQFENTLKEYHIQEHSFFKTSSPIVPTASSFAEASRFNLLNSSTINDQALSESEYIEISDINMSTTFDITGFHKSIPEYDGKVDSLNRFIGVAIISCRL